MRLLGKLLVVIALLFTAFIHSVSYAKLPLADSSIQGSRNLASAINLAVNRIDPNLNIGIAIKSMTYGDILYAHNEYRTFVPASIVKVLTAEAALLYLGSDYKFQTNFYTDAPNITDGVLNGNLYLVHSGDPTLTYNDLIDLMDALKGQQITEVLGNVYIDTTAYDQSIYGPGWIGKDTRYCYAAPISASIINHNCLSFRIGPGKSVGHPASIFGTPSSYYAGFRNSVITKPPKTRSCYVRLDNNPDSSISLTGCMNKGRYIQGVSTVINNVVEYNKSLLRTLFNRSGIHVSGGITAGVMPENLPVVVSHQSKPLYLLINDMLKKSDNVIAGSLFKKMGETFTKQPGSWENGSKAVTHVLSQTAHVNVGNMNVIDGSGLSRNNQLSPSQMLQLLDFAFHDKATNYEFISGLPVAGVDGTLKHRLYNIAWRVRAKTGTMTGVNSLAGYAVTRDKEPLAFVIIVNGHTGLGWKYKGLEDSIVTTLTKFSRRG